jgi:hypothetical protein
MYARTIKYLNEGGEQVSTGSMRCKQHVEDYRWAS